MGSLLIKNKGSIFPPIGFPDKIQIGDGIYNKVIGSIIIPPFANFNQGFYYVKDDTYYIGPINTDVRWLFVDTDANILGLAPDIPNDRLPYNNFDWSNPPENPEFITLPKGGDLKTNKKIITQLKPSNSDTFEYIYEDSPYNEYGSILINLFDPTTDTGLGSNAGFAFYDGSFSNNTASNFIDVYSDGENWLDLSTDEILNDIPIPKGKSLIFYTIDFADIDFPVNETIIIHKLNSGKIRTNLPISISADPPLVVRGDVSPLSPTPIFCVLINSDLQFSAYLTQMGYEINNYKQFIYNTYGVNIDFNLHFVVLLTKKSSSIGNYQYTLIGQTLDIHVDLPAITFPAFNNYYQIIVFSRDLNKFNNVSLNRG